MDRDRSTAVLVHPDQWARCVHSNTRLVDGGGVALDWSDDETIGPMPEAAAPAGLAFDRWCRSYRAWPGLGRVTVGEVGRMPGRPTRGVLHSPRGLAVDGRQRLYVVETGGGAVHVVDLWARRLLRRVPVCATPLDVGGGCCGATVLVRGPGPGGPALVRIEGRRGPVDRPVPRAPAEGLTPVRVTGDGADVLLLWTRDGQAVVARPDGTVVVTVDGATDVELTGDLLVVAREPGRALRRFRNQDGRWAEVEPLGAPDYDGAAIAAAPDGRIAVTTAYGFAWTSGPRVRYAPTGRVVGYRLDAGAYRARWGRVFLDACLPPGTDVGLRFVTSDDDEVDDPLPWRAPNRPPDRLPDAADTPPQASSTALAGAEGPRSLFRRSTGREWPWAQIAADDPLETYEAPVNAPPGRYLWIALELSGGGTATPRVRALRAERPGHRLLAQLPRSWSRSEPDAAVLHRFLAPAEGLLHELDERAAARALLLDPFAAPSEVLGWLAGLVGLVTDRRWPEPARRALVAEAVELFRVRGTATALERLLRLYLRTPVTVMDDWRLRGLAGAVLGTVRAAPAPAVGGAAGPLGGFVVGGQEPGTDSYTVAAHRFTVVVPDRLDEERRAVVRSVVDTHKPAHTLGVICEVGAGMRVGRLLHVGLTAVVGPGPDREPPVLGDALLGGDVVVGSPAVGARVGTTSRVGEVRVG